MRGSVAGLSVGAVACLVLAAWTSVAPTAPMPTAALTDPGVPVAAPAGWPSDDAGQMDPAELRELVGGSVLTMDGLLFSPNVGQAPPDVRFVARAGSYEVHLLDDRIAAIGDGEAIVVRFDAPARALEGERAAVAKWNHFLGPDEAQWRTDVPTFGAVRYAGLGEGWDLVVHSEGGRLRFDHVLAPGAKVEDVRFTVEGAPARLEDGRIVAAATHGVFALDAPRLFQGDDGRQAVVDGGFRDLGDGAFGYWTGPYDASQGLTIDPTLHYQTFMGGFLADRILAVAVRDPGLSNTQRDIYFAGIISGQDWPASTPAANRYTYGGSVGISLDNALVGKVRYDYATQTGTTLWYLVYGDNANEGAQAIALTSTGDAVITGYTYSNALPLMNPVRDVSDNRGTYDGSVPSAYTGWQEPFIARFHRDGNALQFGTYFGGGGYHVAFGTAVDSAGNIIIVGEADWNWLFTPGEPYPTKAPHQPNHANLGQTTILADAFVTKINPNTSPATIVFSTYLGGLMDEGARAVAVDAANNVYVTGFTTGGTFPVTPGVFQGGPQGVNDVFVAKYNPTGTLQYSTFLGGSGSDMGLGIAVGAMGTVWVVGSTASSNFPACTGSPPPCSATPVQATLRGGTDAFVVQLNAAASGPLYASFLGGSVPSTSGGVNAFDEATSVALDPASGHVTVVGRTQSVDFPVAGIQPAANPAKLASGTSYDAFVVRINPASTTPLLYGTYLGGASNQWGHGVAVDDRSNTYVGGFTETGFNVRNATQPTFAGGSWDGWLAAFSKSPPTAVIRASAPGFPTAVARPATTYTVTTMTPVSLTGINTTAGDMPLGPLSWQLFDGGGIPIGAPVAGNVPTFSPMDFSVPTQRRVCLTATDTDTRTPPWRTTDTVCLRIDWLNRPPVSFFTATPNPTTIGTPVAFTHGATDLDGTIVAFNWWFGDGGTSTLPNPTHAYASAGTHNVRLMVTDDRGATANFTVAVNVVQGPLALFSVAPPFVVGAPVAFTDLSSQGLNPITSWFWEFGDGATLTLSSAPTAPVEHTYAASGVYLVRLRVSDGTLSDDHTISVTVGNLGPQPQPDAYSVVQGTSFVAVAPGVLANDGHPTGAPMTAVLGTPPAQGSVVVGSNGAFTYTPNPGFVGTDTWTYTVSDGPNQVTGVVVQMTVRAPVPPAAVAFVSVNGLSAQFIDHSTAGDNPIVAWAWDFGDGATSTLPSPTHVYGGSGTFVAQLTVTDSVGLQASRVLTVTTTAASAGGGAGGGTGGGYHGYGVGEAPAAEAAAPAPGNVNRPPLAVGAATAGQLGQPTVLDARGSSDPDGHELSYTWRQVGGPAVDVADALRPQASFVPILPGMYVFELAVGDPYAVSRARVEILVDAPEGLAVPPGPSVPPAAAFGATPAGLAVRLTADDVADATYRWDLGDGTVREGREVAHRYAQAGPYAVTLTVTTVGGSQSMTQVLTVAGAPGDAPAAPAPGLDELRYTPSGASATPAGMWLAVGLVGVLVVGGTLMLLARRR